MIQRIQSLYLLATITLMTFASFFPLINLFDNEAQHFILNAKEITLDGNIITQTLPVFILCIITIIINTITLLLYRKRVLQIRLQVFSIILQLGFYSLGAFCIYQSLDITKFFIRPTVVITFPLIACIFSYLAIRAIGKDEVLVRSLDRIR